MFKAFQGFWIVFLRKKRHGVKEYCARKFSSSNCRIAHNKYVDIMVGASKIFPARLRNEFKNSSHIFRKNANILVNFLYEVVCK